MTQEEYIAKYGEKEGLRRWKQAEYNRRYYETNKEKMNERSRQYRKAHPEIVKEINRRWYTANPDYNHQYYKTNKEQVKEINRRYYETNKEQVKETRRRYREKHPDIREADRRRIARWNADHPMENRAKQLIRNYRRNDQKYHRGDCTLTKQWVLDNILTGHCIYCGETDWRLLGCDRKNNSKPHTPGNVVCSCKRCNKKRNRKDIITYALSIGAVESDGITI